MRLKLVSRGWRAGAARMEQFCRRARDCSRISTQVDETEYELPAWLKVRPWSWSQDLSCSERRWIQISRSLLRVRRGPKGSRGRIFDACSSFPQGFSDILLPACSEWVLRARRADRSMPAHRASHLLLLYYRSGGTLGFHRDEQANDGTGNEPVVNLTLGAEVDFAVRHEHADVARVITLRSGDVIMFGGPCRRLLHAVVATRSQVSSVLPADAEGGRLSFTLRHAPEVLGKEHLYADFRPQADDPRRKTTGDEVLLGTEEAAKRLRKMRG
eukprot:TRINITY_DN17350_c0_g1_i2.p1 TRINITY_DN17350_c0_g1~~TRINITY_DN17350_c0_g1_i2.p1  ORF type:complete len:271 (-),score=30.34 TRINITY_DN17350_c0_g1_i2:65-877(-)